MFKRNVREVDVGLSKMRTSTRRKLKSAIICEHTLDDTSEESSARTRPLSYDEIMLKRKNKKEAKASGEEAHETKTARDEEIVRNSDRWSRNTNGTALKSSRDSKQEASPRKKVEKSTRKAQTHIKSDTRDFEREASSRKKVEKSSRKEQIHIKSEIRDFQRESSPRKKMEKSTGTKDAHIKGDTQDSQWEESPRKKVEKSSRTEHSHNDFRDSQREASPRKKLEKSSRTDHIHNRSDSHRVSPRKVEKSIRNEHTHNKSENKERRVESRSKHKTGDYVRSDTESKNDRLDRVDERSRGDARYCHENKHHMDSVVQDRYIERSGIASGRENRRRDRSREDEIYKTWDPVKKHDSGSRHNSEISERKVKVELSRSHHDETRSKRRRSISQEHIKEKARRSRSSSPKSRKNVFDLVHDHNELSSYSERDRSRRHSDVDRSKISSDGSSSHLRRHGGSSSGLGGYSPRKRKSEAAVKTPSPIHSPERKSAGWDRPPGADRNLSTAVPPGAIVSQTKSSNIIELAAGFSVASSMGKPISAILSNNVSSFKQASIDSVQLTQATRPLRRLYIDNIPVSATEKDIMDCFNSFLLTSGSNYIRGTLPCISCMIHKEKGQALVEFLTPEDASAALSFDGRSLSGSILKIRRPKDFVEVPSGSSEKSKTGADSIRIESISEVATHSISDYVEDSPHKIFVGGIAEGISSEMMKEIFSAFGTLKAYRLIVNEDLKEPFAYLEYADQSVTLKACAGLNGLRLGGRVLTVAQAVPYTKLVESSGIPPFYGIPEHVKPLLEMPTQVLKLSNVLDLKTMDSLSETNLEEIVEDVRVECSRFGSVVSINVVKGGNTHIVIAETKEVTDDVKPIQPSVERNHHLNEAPKEIVVDHYDRDDSTTEPPINSKGYNATDVLEGDKLELVLATTNIDLEVGSAGISHVGESKDAGILPQNSVDEADKDPQEAVVIDVSTVDDIGKVNDSKGNHLEASIQESSVSYELNSYGNMDTEKSHNGGTLHTEDVSELDENGEMLQEAVPLPANVGAADDLNNEKSCDGGNIFEVGCILVEFRRTEASCMAAHCLHGRAFDERIVTVEYVSLKAYRERFPK